MKSNSRRVLVALRSYFQGPLIWLICGIAGILISIVTVCSDNTTLIFWQHVDTIVGIFATLFGISITGLVLFQSLLGSQKLKGVSQKAGEYLVNMSLVYLITLSVSLVLVFAIKPHDSVHFEKVNNLIKVILLTVYYTFNFRTLVTIFGYVFAISDMIQKDD